MKNPPPPSEHMVETDYVRSCRNELITRLLAARNDGGHWEGELSSSALSTATAVFALSLYIREAGKNDSLAELVARGLAWLAATQNADGGWGDTTNSPSNISTTALCWATLGIPEAREFAPQTRRAETWLIQAAGSLEPHSLARTIGLRYGKDRTFSVPILTMCALSGRFGNGREAWRNVIALPFELAVFPRSWYRTLKLPVVSYALPALIAIGQVGFHQNPPHNPLLRLARRSSIEPSLRTLREIQPSDGGFLEATPLTSFVVMSLIAAARTGDPVVQKGIEFLTHSARPDGSWPIDTNLSTWLTTLAVNALAASGSLKELPEHERRTISEWLLGQQYTAIHPYTGAQPGGWAWTDLPGGVPDADDTAGALLALHYLGDIPAMDSVNLGVRWLLDLQNRDGGIPTFCRGWGALPFDRSGADLTAHALAAWNAWLPHLPNELAARVTVAMRRGTEYLERTQSPEGFWLPLWFGNQSAPDDGNPVYGTSRVLQALHSHPRQSAMVDRATRWLAEVQNPDGGWGGDHDAESSIEETSLAVQALGYAHDALSENHAVLQPVVSRGVQWLSERINQMSDTQPKPIGLYFAKLWYFDSLYPLIFATGAFAGLNIERL